MVVEGPRSHCANCGFESWTPMLEEYARSECIVAQNPERRELEEEQLQCEHVPRGDSLPFIHQTEP